MSWSDDAKLGSGLPDRFLLTIRSARMKTPDGWDNDVVMLEGEQNVDGEIEDSDVRLSTGAFEAGDKDGTFLVHGTQPPEIFDTPGSKKKKINKNSAYGRFLNSALEVMVPLEENQAPERAKYEIWDLLMWEGLTVDVEMVERQFEYQNDIGTHKKGDTGSTRDAFVRGFVEGGASAGGAGANTAAVPSAASSNGAVNFKDHESYISFLEAHVEAGGSPSDDTAKAAKEHFDALKA